MDEIKQYVENAITEGREVTKHYANRCGYICDYIFIKEDDGWISIISITDGIGNTVVQESYHSSKGYGTRFKGTHYCSCNDFVKYKRMV